MSTPKTLDAMATSILETVKEDGTPPYPPGIEADPKHRMFQPWNVQLAAGAEVTLTAAYEPETWHIWTRRGASSDGYFVAFGRLFSPPYLWQQADKAFKVPGRGKAITIKSDATSTLDLFITATSNFDVIV